jgi:hypothetical protein
VLNVGSTSSIGCSCGSDSSTLQSEWRQRHSTASQSSTVETRFRVQSSRLGFRDPTQAVLQRPHDLHMVASPLQNVSGQQPLPPLRPLLLARLGCVRHRHVGAIADAARRVRAICIGKAADGLRGRSGGADQREGGEPTESITAFGRFSPANPALVRAVPTSTTTAPTSSAAAAAAARLGGGSSSGGAYLRHTSRECVAAPAAERERDGGVGIQGEPCWEDVSTTAGRVGSRCSTESDWTRSKPLTRLAYHGIILLYIVYSPGIRVLR